MTRYIQLMFLLSVICLSACNEEEMATNGECDITGTVRDFTGVDGCGFVFEDDEGNIYEPMSKFWCPTGVPAEELQADPLYNFQYVDGKRISFSYETVQVGSICMVGQTVVITCLEEIKKGGGSPE